MQNDRAVLIGSCTSSVLDNAYGWTFWKSRLAFTASVVENFVQVTLVPQAGFSPSKSDVVTCGLGLPGTDGRTYNLNTTSSSDLYASFTVTPAKQVLSTVFFSCTGGDSSKLSKTQATYTETAVRNNGLCIEVWMVGDNWDPTLVSSLTQYLDCTSEDTASCAQFRQLVRNPANLRYDSYGSPQRFVVAISRNVTRAFNPSNNLKIGFVLPSDRGQMYGAKAIAYQRIVTDNNFTLSGYINLLIVPRFRQLNLTLMAQTGGTPASTSGTESVNFDLSENCIRGVNKSYATCPMLISIYLTTAVVEFLQLQGTTSYGWNDLRDLGFYSNATGGYLSTNFLRTSFSPVDASAKILSLYLYLNGDPSYETATKDVIQVYLPYSMFTPIDGVQEPPAFNLTFTVWPSPGNISSDLFDSGSQVRQSLYWFGGIKYRITLGGESFLPSILDDLLNLTTVQGVADSYGWNTWKSCAFPNGSIYFDKSPSGAQDRRVLVMDMQECTQYSQSVATETIALTIGAQYLASGLPLAAPPAMPLTFTVLKSTPVYGVTGTLVYTIDDVLGGQVTFRIVLRGGTAFLDGRVNPLVAGDCATELGATMTATAFNTNDALGWANASVRGALLNGNSMTYIDDKYGTLTILQVTLQGGSSYFTSRGESISFGDIPARCVQSGEAVSVASPTNLRFTARVGVITVSYNMGGSSSTAPSQLSAFPASTLRKGGVNVVITMAPTTDTFQAQSANMVSIITNAFQCVSPQPFGFRATRAQILNVTVLNSLQIVVTFNALPQFAVTAVESVFLAIDASWTTSQQTPTITSNRTFVINPSPGSIQLLSSFVQSVDTVTEGDVRAGNMWFQFAMIGDLWRQEREPYIEMFSGPTGEATGLLALVDELVPSIEYFNFTSSDTYQYLTVRLQTSTTYDISAVETIRIAFSADSASSGLAPLFDLGDGAFTFQIHPSAGRLVVSGRTALTEKIVREGGTVLYLTLFGERWTSAAAQCVRSGISIPTSDARNQLLSSTIIPTYGNSMNLLSRSTLSVTMFPARSGTNVYILGSNESDLLLINVSASCVVSGLAPIHGVSTLDITRTKGELTLGGTTPAVITEDVIRTQSIQIQIVIDGSSWATGIDQQPESISLLEGFSSTSSPLQQPSGFLVHRDAMFSLRSLTVVPDILKTSKSITVRTVAQPTYDITEDEVITFTVTDADFIANGELPSPAQVSFVVKALPQEVFIRYQPPGGQFVATQLEASVERILSISSTTSSSSSSSNASATYKSVSASLVSQNGLVYYVSIRFNVTVSEEDPRTNVELLNALFSLDPAYVFAQSGIKCSALALDSLCPSDASTPSPLDVQSSDDDAITIAYWLIGAASVLALFVMVVVVAFLTHKRELGGGLRSGSTTHKVGRRSRLPQYLTGQGPTTSEVPVASRLLTPMSLRAYAQSRSGQQHNGKSSNMDASSMVFEEADQTASLASASYSATQRQQQQVAADETYRSYERLLKRHPNASVSVQKMMDLDN